MNPEMNETVSSRTTITSTTNNTNPNNTENDSGSGSNPGMGMKAKALASSAYDSIKKNVSAAADVTTKNIARLQSRPTVLTCSNTACAKQLPIPPSVWTWKCTQGHENPHGNQECQMCHESKLNALGHTISWPALLCQNCGTVTAVPHSELENSLYNSAYLVRHSFHELADPPKTFHCGNCNTLLLVPTGSWVCQTCTTQNYAGATQCSKCSQSKSSQKVICGQCRKSTGIPTSGLLDNISSAFKSLASSTTKAYLDVTGQQNVACPTCKHPIRIPLSFQPIPVEPGQEAKHPEERKMPPQPLSSNSAAELAHQSWSLTLNCENCHNSFQLLKHPQQPQHLTTVTAPITGSAAAPSSTSMNDASSSSSSTSNSSSAANDLNAIRHAVLTSDGQQVASLAPVSAASSSAAASAASTDSLSSEPSRLYNASNAPAATSTRPTNGSGSSIGAADSHATMPASSTTVSKNL
jgi:hypothetical protein